jgi:serine/threonine-protein kinase
MAEYLVEVGRDPAPSLDLARQSIEAARKLSPDWFVAFQLLAYADCYQARYELGSGSDPSVSLDRAVNATREHAKRARSESDSYEILGMAAMTRALFLLQRGEDPRPVLREAREAFQHKVDAAPWDLLFRVWRARVEIVELRWALSQRKAKDEQFQAAFAPLLPLLDKERVDPRFYQTLAEIHALRAAWLLSERKSPGESISKGLEMAAKALALNPRMATALANRGALLLVQARAAKDPEARIEAARQAEVALSAAVRENPKLEREQAQALAEVKALLGRP